MAGHSERVAPTDINSLLKDKDEFAARLAQTFEPTEIVRLLTAMDLRPSDLALALNVHPRTIRAWLDESDQRTAERQRDDILALKSIVLFLLRRGPYAPAHLAAWLVEPNPALTFRRPLAVLGESDTEEGLIRVMKAGAPFISPEEPISVAPYHQSVAAGAAGRSQPSAADPPAPQPAREENEIPEIEPEDL